ncbi:MAG: hypothetical protein ACXVCP_18990 [Bdellovibrio sp.]
MGKIKGLASTAPIFFPLVYLMVCGCSPKPQAHNIERPTFLVGQIIPESVRQDQLENAEFSLNDDLDGDGIIDRLDADIDGDGVLNLVDEAPFDPHYSGEDKDGDGIPDWIDYSVGGILKNGVTPEIASMQEKIFNNFHVYIISDKTPWTEPEIQLIQNEISKGIYTKYPSLSKFTPVIVKNENSDPNNLEYGRYHPFWKTLFIDSKVKNVEEIFLHEVFHAFEHFDLSKYNQFLKISGWTVKEDFYQTIYIFRSPNNSKNKVEINEFDLNHNLKTVSAKLVGPWFPTEYSKMGPEEMFAECGVASLLKIRSKENNYVKDNQFYQTQIFKWFENKVLN